MLVRYSSSFETGLGWCGIVWSAAGVASIRLPMSLREPTEKGAADMERLLAEQFPYAIARAPSPHAAAAIDAVVRSLAGQDAQIEARLQAVVLDLDDVPPFARSVYEEARRIPRGETRSYGEVARALGKPGASRAVGQALGRNPFPPVVPCHRVVAKGGGAGGFTAPGGLTTKARLLAIEGKQVVWGT